MSQANSYMKENGIFVREYGEVSSDTVLLASDQLTPSSADKTPAGLNVETNCGKATGNGEIPAAEFVHDLIWVDTGACCFALYLKLNADKVLLKQSPLALAKALKVILTTQDNSYTQESCLEFFGDCKSGRCFHRLYWLLIG